ncbi:MAG: YdeI/OmpD-associated family protein [Acidimicrobiia bacterium]
MTNYRPGLTDVERPDEAAPTFETTAYAIGVNVVVDVPAAVSEWFGERGNIPVLGLLQEKGIRATLVPVGDGRHRMFLNEEMRRACAIEIGDTCRLVLWRDDTLRHPQLPDDVRMALSDAAVLDVFLSWPPSHQREYLVVIEDSKTPQTRRRRIERTISDLGG